MVQRYPAHPFDRKSRSTPEWAFFTALLGLAAACAGSPATTSPDVAAPAQLGGPVDPSEVEDFFDRVLGGQLEAEHLQGAAVAVVRDGRLLFAKGYGFAELELSALLGWPIRALLGRVKKQPLATAPIWARRARGLTLVLTGLNFLFVGGFIMLLTEFSARPWGTPGLLVPLLIVPLLTTLLAVGLVGLVLVAWRKSFWGMLARVHFTLVVLAALLFPAWLNYWNLLGLRL